MANFHVDYNYTDHRNTPRRIVADLAISTSTGAGNTITSGVGSSALSIGASGFSSGASSGVIPIPTYLGAFRLPSDTINLTSFSTGAITGRTVGGDIRLIITGNMPTYDGPIIEIEDPGSYSTNYATSPIATRTGFWTADYAAAHRGTWRGSSVDEPPPGGPMQTISSCEMGGLLWDESQQRLFATYYDTYNVGGYRDWGLLSIQLSALDATNQGTTTGYGPWRLKGTDADGLNFYGPHRGLWLSAHPITGKLITGASLGSGNASGCWGPSLYGGIDLPTDSTTSGYNAPDLQLTSRWLNHYYMGTKLDTSGNPIPPHPLRSFRRRVHPAIFEHFEGQVPDSLSVNGQSYTDAFGLTGSWSEADYTGGHVWVEGASNHGVIFCGIVCGSPSQDPTDPYAGHEYYGNNINNWICTHGFDYRALFVPPRDDPATGPNTHAAFPFMCCYDPEVLEEVRNTALDYTPEPEWFINLETEFPGFQTRQLGKKGGKTISMGHYDAASGKLFCVSHQGDESQFGSSGALIHVFQLDT